MHPLGSLIEKPDGRFTVVTSHPGGLGQYRLLLSPPALVLTALVSQPPTPLANSYCESIRGLEAITPLCYTGVILFWIDT